MAEVDLDGLSVEIAGLCAALSGMDSIARRVLAEKMFNHLLQEQPWTARISATLIAALGEEETRPLGMAVLSRLSDGAAADYRRQVACILDRHRTVDPTNPLRVDVLLLVIKEIELIACLRAFDLGPDSEVITKLDHGTEVYLAENGGYRYAIAWVGTDGNVESAITIARLFTVLNFRLAVLIGMAAGVSGEVNPGDVVVSEAVWAVDFEVIRADGGHSPRPKTYSPPARLYSGLTNLRIADPDWATRVRDEVTTWCETDPLCVPPNDLTEEWYPKVSRGVIFAGSRLIEDGSLPQLREDRHARLLAAEMEGAGFAAACDEHRDVADWLVFRGIADYGEEPRLKDWQFAASYAAAALLRDAMRLGRIGIRADTTPSALLTED